MKRDDASGDHKFYNGYFKHNVKIRTLDSNSADTCGQYSYINTITCIKSLANHAISSSTKSQ